MGAENGLFYPDGEFRTDSQVRRKLALEGVLPEMEFVTPVPIQKDVNSWLDEAQIRADSMNEFSLISENHIEVNLPRTSIVNVMGDLHFGHPDTNYQRIEQELEVIRNTGDSYVLLVGDLVDGIFWGGESGGEQSMGIKEQHGFLRSFFDSLKGKVVAAVSGEHDSKWAARSGIDPYEVMTEEMGVPYIRGVAEIELHVGEQDYNVVAQHRARGFSMYNKNHPTQRQTRFDLQGGDIYVSAHTHRKQVSQEAIRDFDESRQVTHISIGAYKSGDAYGQRSGFPEMHPEEMFGSAFQVHLEEHRVDVEFDILKAHEKWAGLLDNQ